MSVAAHPGPAATAKPDDGRTKRSPVRGRADSRHGQANDRRPEGRASSVLAAGLRRPSGPYGRRATGGNQGSPREDGTDERFGEVARRGVIKGGAVEGSGGLDGRDRSAALVGSQEKDRQARPRMKRPQRDETGARSGRRPPPRWSTYSLAGGSGSFGKPTTWRPRRECEAGEMRSFRRRSLASM